MWFVHSSEGERTYVMRGMSFPIDIVFVDADGEITSIHHASLDGEADGYTGTGKYVLEVPYGYTTENGIEVGDRAEVRE